MDNNILFFDTETTGLPQWKEPSGGENQPHIVQLGAILANADTREIIKEVDLIVQPNGWRIAQETIDLHGITFDVAMSQGLPEAFVLNALLELNARASIRVMHGSTFDNRIIRIATKRYTDEATQEFWKKGVYACTGRMSTKPMGRKPSGFKIPKLVDAYKFFTGNDHPRPHNALYDARCCMEIYWSIQDLNNKAE